MLYTYIFSGSLLRRRQPLQTGVPNMLGYEPGLVIRPKLDFLEPLPISLWVYIKSLQIGSLYLLEVRKFLQRVVIHCLLGRTDKAGDPCATLEGQPGKSLLPTCKISTNAWNGLVG